MNCCDAAARNPNATEKVLLVGMKDRNEYVRLAAVHLTALKNKQYKYWLVRVLLPRAVMLLSPC